jgi:hypothetical protein
VAGESIRLLEQHKDNPFFIAAGFSQSHVPCIAPNKYFDLYPLEKIPLLQERLDHLASIPPLALAVKPFNYGITPDQLRAFTLACFASISVVDAQIGYVIDALNSLKLAEQAIVVLFSDHGFLLGQYGQWQKMSLFEEPADLEKMKIMNKKREQMKKVVALVLLGYALGLLVGEALRDRMYSGNGRGGNNTHPPSELKGRKWQLYWGLFVLLKQKLRRGGEVVQ